MLEQARAKNIKGRGKKIKSNEKKRLQGTRIIAEKEERCDIVEQKDDRQVVAGVAVLREAVCQQPRTDEQQ